MEPFDEFLLDCLDLVDESPVGLSAVEPLVVEWRLDDFGNSGMSLAAEFCDLKLLRLESTNIRQKILSKP